MASRRMSAQDLDHRVGIYRLTGATDTYGAKTQVYALAFEVWAKRTDASMGEALRAREVSAQITAHFGVRYSPDTATITPKDRLVLESGLEYNITGIRELVRNRWLEIHAAARSD